MVLLLQLLLLAGIGLSLPKSLFKQVSTYAEPWPNHTVYYFFDGNFTKEERDKVNQGVRILEENTCIKFIEGKTDKFAIKITKNRACSSAPGFVGGLAGPNSVQGMSLDPHGAGKCLAVIGITVHEFLHALGLKHTQTRTDRDHYITVNTTNIKEPFDFSQYAKEPFLNITPYDYTSYMHYAAFPNGDYRSVNIDVPTMLTKDRRYRKTIGNLRGSFYDFYTVNEFYKCNEKCSSRTSAKCFNGGVPHPRHCAICLCPSGFEGDFCDQRPGTCGETFSALPNKAKSLFLSIGEKNKKKEFAPTACTYWIQAPPGHRVDIMFTGVKQYGHSKRSRAEKASCRFSGFEFKINKDPRLGGPIFCDREDWGANLVSDLNPAPLMLFNYEGKQVYDFLYKAVPI